MSQENRHDDATAVAGLTLFGAGRSANHYALERAYQKKERPRRLFNERKLFTSEHHGGRPLLALGTALTTVGASAGATGVVNRFYRPKKIVKRDGRKRPTFLEEARRGVTSSLRDRVTTTTNPTPPHLMAENYAGGAAATAVGGGLINAALKRTKIHAGLGAGIAGAGGLVAGALTLPIQSKIIRRQSHGKYEVTPTGVRRRAAVAKYYGQDLTSRQKRTRVMSASGVPIIPFAGDVAAASTAASMAPPELRKKTAALQFGGAQAGGLVTGAAGAYGATALSRHARVQSGAKRAGEVAGRHQGLIDTATAPKRHLDTKVSAARTKVGLKSKSAQNPLERVVEHSKTPKFVKGALKPLMHNPKVAVAAGVVGSTIGGQTGGYVGYGHALNLERERNIKSADNRHGVSKRSAMMSPADSHKQAKKKRLQANISVFTGSTGVAALAAGLASKAPKLRASKWGARLAHAQTPLLTAGAGVGGAGSFNFARYTRDEANAQEKGVRKALGLPRIPGAPRVPTVRAGSLVSTRRASGVTTTATRRGGLVR